jgi:two-component system CAI-1 autoinducer sensor kinase/phosphatase CqsS
MRWLRLGTWSLRRAWERFESSIFARARYSEPKMVLMGVLGTIGFPLYWIVWAVWFPQPYENLPLRLLGSALCLPLLLQRRWPRRLRPWLPLHWYITMSFGLPFFFTYMMLQNGANNVWLLSHLCSVFLLVMLFDIGAFLVTSITGYLAAFTAYLLSPHTPMLLDALGPYLPVWAFGIISGSVFSISQAMSNQARVDAIIAASNNIAHELRTPLAAVSIATGAVQRYLPSLVQSHRAASAAQLAVEDLREAHLQRLERALDTVGREVVHANTVIDMLLVAARPIGEMALERLSASDCAQEAMRRFPFASRQERDRVGLHVKADFELRGSRLLLVHVMFNLIKNALFHTSRAGHGLIELRVEADAQGRRVICHDTGPGIPPDVLPHIYERFYSSATDYSTGLGVGLAFVRNALAHMGATIHCQSEFGQYTEFVIAFPKISEGDD